QQQQKQQTQQPHTTTPTAIQSLQSQQQQQQQPSTPTTATSSSSTDIQNIFIAGGTGQLGQAAVNSFITSGLFQKIYIYTQESFTREKLKTFQSQYPHVTIIHSSSLT